MVYHASGGQLVLTWTVLPVHDDPVIGISSFNSQALISSSRSEIAQWTMSGNGTWKSKSKYTVSVYANGSNVFKIYPSIKTEGMATQVLCIFENRYVL